MSYENMNPETRKMKEDDKNLSDFQREKVDLYLEQIRYITAENNSIQEKFLTGVDIPLVALGLLIFYIESEEGDVKKLYLLLPFFCLFVIYNLIKYSIRILINNGYLQHLECQINKIYEEKVFLMNQGLRDISTFKNLGFAVLTTGAQIPIYVGISIFLMYRFKEVCIAYEDIRDMANVLVVLLLIELFFLIMMGIDAINDRKIVVKKAKTMTISESDCMNKE